MFASLLGLAAAVTITSQAEGGKNRVVLGIRDSEHKPNSPYDEIRPDKAAPDYSWKGVTIDPDKNFCRHLASGLQDNRTGAEKTHVDTCTGIDEDACVSSYMEAEAGNFQLCEYGAECGGGNVHQCTWAFFMEDLIRKQTDNTGASCYGEVLEAKRSLDGLLHSVNETYSYLMLYNQIIHEENITIREQLLEQQTLWSTYVETEETCMSDALQAWKKHVKPLRTELEELEAIAEPEVRSRAALPDQDLAAQGYTQNAAGTWTKENSAIGETQAPTGLSLVDTHPSREFSFAQTGGEVSQEACETFASLIERVQTQHGVKLSKAVNCHDQRTNLRIEFTNAFNKIVLEMNMNNKTVFDNRTNCLNGATYEYKEGVEGTGKIDDQIQDAAERIHRAQSEIARLEPRFHDVEHAVVRMRHYIEQLKGHCHVDEDVTAHLQKIRNLILDLQECPGRNDFSLTVPHWTHPPPVNTPAPTPWADRYS